MHCTAQHCTLQVLECDEFYGLSPDQVSALIASDTITVPNEEKVLESVVIIIIIIIITIIIKVFESVISWIQHSEESRAQHLPSLMEHIRLPLLSQEYLIHKVHCMLHIAHGTFHIAHSTRQTAQCILHSMCCRLTASHC